MSKKAVTWAITIIMIMVGSSNLFAQQTEKEAERFVGKWDSHAGIVSFFVKKSAGAKQSRMVVADEYVEGKLSKLSFDMSASELDELEDLIEDTVNSMGDPAALPIPPLGTKEVVKRVGKITYPNGNIIFSIIDPAGTRRYASMVVKEKDDRFQHVFWMEKEDLQSLKKLLDKALKELGES